MCTFWRMRTNRAVTTQQNWAWVTIATALLGLPAMTTPSVGQTLLYQEGFNDDGDGTRYFVTGRGSSVSADGPAMWDNNFLVDQIGLPSIAPAKRAAILSSYAMTFDQLSEDQMDVWFSLVDWMVDGKKDARILWVPGIASTDLLPDVLSFEFENKGYETLIYDGTALPPATDVDLVIHTNEGAIAPPTAFVSYPVPVITFNGDNHDDTLISTIGANAIVDPPVIKVVEANAGHPALGGKTGTLEWATEPVSLSGIGGAVPTGSKTLATYIDPNTSLELPALLVVEKGGNLLGAFDPEPEGAGFFVGGDMNADIGGVIASDTDPRVVELKPVDVSGQENVKVTIALAATNVDFEAPDFLQISYAPNAGADFMVFPGGRFNPVNDATSVNNKALSNGELVLSPNEFRDITFDVPADATDLIIKVEAYSTFPNEVVGFDNIRITAGSLVVGDCNGDGAVTKADVDCACGNKEDLSSILASIGSLPGDADFDGQVQFPDFVILANNFGKAGQYSTGDFDCDGQVQFPDFVILANNFGKSGSAAAAAVPEPASWGLLALGLAWLPRRRRGKNQ